VVGLVFLGEPRSEAARTAQPAVPAIQTAMVILALTCILFGLMPQYIIPIAQQAALFLVPAHAGGQILATSAMATNLSLAAAGFIAFVLLIIALRRLMRKGKATHLSTWGCGFTQANTRMQYTGSSYAASFLDFYRPFVIVREKFSGIHGLFPKTAKYHSETIDVSELGLHRAIVQPTMVLTAKFRWLQHGHIQLYIGYIFVALLGLLFWLIAYGGLS